MGRIRLDVPRVDQDVGKRDAKSDLRLAKVEVLHQMECRVPDEPVVSWRSRIAQLGSVCERWWCQQIRLNFVAPARSWSHLAPPTPGFAPPTIGDL